MASTLYNDAYYHVVADTLGDLPTASPGMTAHVIDTDKTYVVDDSPAWLETPKQSDVADIEADLAALTTTVGTKQAVSTAVVQLFGYITDAPNTNTDETTLYTDNIAAAQLSANKARIEAEYFGVFVGSATATRQIRVKFAGTTILDTGALGIAAAAAWNVETTIIRVSNTVVRCTVALATAGASLALYTQYTEITSLNLTTTAYALAITGEADGVGAASSDVLARGGFVEYSPAP